MARTHHPFAPKLSGAWVGLVVMGAASAVELGGLVVAVAFEVEALA